MTARPHRLRRNADPPGYWLGDELRDGFVDDPGLRQGERLRIAGWGRALAPDELAPEQWDLLERGAPTPSAAQREAERLARYDASPFWRYLSAEQRALARKPSRHHALSDVGYPLGVGELATLVDATADQIRRWHDAGLLPARRTPGGHRKFYAAAAVRAFFLRRLGQKRLALLRELANGRGAETLVGISVVLHEQAGAVKSDERDVLQRAALELEHASAVFEPAQ
jgi:DNA-binding transcriptional MerR regulator